AGTASLITGTFIAHRNGSIAIPLILLLSLGIYVLMSYSMYSFSRHISSAGGYYTFVSRGLGSSAGFITALSYLTYGILSFTGFGILGFLGFSYAILPSIGIAIPYPNLLWIPVSLFFIFLVSFLIYMGIKPSLRYVSYTIFIEIGFLIASSIILIIMYRNTLSVVPFTPAPLGNDPFTVFAMMVYAIGAYVGIGGSIPIAEETKHPKKNVPLAIIITVIILGVTIILSSYAQVIAWGFSNMFSFGSATQPYPLLYIYRSKFGYASMAMFLALIVIVLNSFFTATVSLGTNATRVLFSMSREGALPKFLSVTNKNNGTPTMAMVTLAIISSIIVVASGVSFEYISGLNPMNALLSSSVFLLILEAPIIYIVHILTNSSLYLFMKKRIKMRGVDYLRYLIIPSASTITLIMA
ncbi:MAG: APC family permease, partial [Thermoplasmata archaeon]